jgi:hypothetical protein
MWLRLSWALSSLFLFAACSAPASAPTQSSFYDGVAQLRPGVSTSTDVARVLGPPNSKRTKRQWVYAYPNSADPTSPTVAELLRDGRLVLLYLDFDGEGVLDQFRLSGMRASSLTPSPPDPNGPLAAPDAPTG